MWKTWFYAIGQVISAGCASLLGQLCCSARITALQKDFAAGYGLFLNTVLNEHLRKVCDLEVLRYPQPQVVVLRILEELSEGANFVDGFLAHNYRCVAELVYLGEALLEDIVVGL